MAAFLSARGAEDLEAITPQVSHEKARVRRRQTGRRDRGLGRALINPQRWGFPRRRLFRIFPSSQEHSPMRIAHPFIMIIHVIGSLRVIHDFGPTPGLFSGVCITRIAESSGRLCAAVGAELSWQPFRRRWDRLSNCSVHQRLLGPAQCR